MRSKIFLLIKNKTEPYKYITNFKNVKRHPFVMSFFVFEVTYIYMWNIILKSIGDLNVLE